MAKGADEVLEYLDKLMQDENWRETKQYAEQLLHRHDLSEADIARIYFALANARFGTHDFDGSAFAATIALSITERLGMWGLYGLVCLTLSATYHRMGDVTRAEQMIHQLLKDIKLCSEQDPSLEVHAWFNLGTLYFVSDRIGDAAKCFDLSLKAATRIGLTRYAHGSRQALIEAYLQMGLFKPLPPLLAKSAHYLRHTNTASPQYRKSLLFHFLLRVKYAVLTRKPLRARVFALRALTMAEGEPLHQYDFHMQLARISRLIGNPLEAAGHSLAAQAFAAQSRQQDLQAEATRFLYDLTVDSEKVLSQVDGYYLQTQL